MTLKNKLFCFKVNNLNKSLSIAVISTSTMYFIAGNQTSVFLPGLGVLNIYMLLPNMMSCKSYYLPLTNNTLQETDEGGLTMTKLITS